MNGKEAMLRLAEIKQEQERRRRQEDPLSEEVSKLTIAEKIWQGEIDKVQWELWGRPMSWKDYRLGYIRADSEHPNIDWRIGLSLPALEALYKLLHGWFGDSGDVRHELTDDEYVALVRDAHKSRNLATVEAAPFADGETNIAHI